jgi:hypothetical protein
VDEHQSNEFDFLLSTNEVIALAKEAVSTPLAGRSAALQEAKNDFAFLNELGTESDWGDAHICPPVEQLEDRFTTNYGESIFI